jgi:UDP-4-amino-4,6-dideoxy-N-acetyl-beta-L-altrosamine transaminase
MADRPVRSFLPYARQAIDPSDIDAVIEVLQSDFLTTGPAVDNFETSLAERVGARHAVSCNSGTAGLHLACLALGIGPGDAAIVPSITFLATANAVRMVGAEPVFADVDPETGLMSPDTLEEALARTGGRRLRAVMPVHLAGQSPDMARIAAIAKAEGAAIIEDACHALGTSIATADGTSVPVGACDRSAMAVFSFHPVKTIAAGEGGAVTTNDPRLAARLKSLRSHGMTRDPAAFQQDLMAFDASGAANLWYYEMAELGWNYRLSDLNAALALSQLARLDQFVAARSTLVELYDDLLADANLPVRPIKRMPNCRAARHLYPVLIPFDEIGIDRNRLMMQLRSQGIGTQVHYIPVHRQPYYSSGASGLTLAGADAYYARTLSLPLFVGMAAADVRFVVHTLSQILVAAAS